MAHERSLQQQIAVCERGGDEHAALLTELAQLALEQGRQQEGHDLLQQAFALRSAELGGSGGGGGGCGNGGGGARDAGAPVAAGASLAPPAGGKQPPAVAAARGEPPPVSAAQPAAAAPPLAGAVAAAAGAAGEAGTAATASPAMGPAETASRRSHDGHGSSEGGGWEQSDDWEPDLSTLRTASSFERDAAASTQGAAGAGASQAPPGAAASGRQQQASSRPRGRGDARCGAALTSTEEWDVMAGLPDQPHIVELYGLTRAVKTSHLEAFLCDYAWAGMPATLRWVDDEHALALFPCADAARVLLDAGQGQYKVRPYSRASGGALQIPAEELTPPRTSRPKTTTAVARRLISNALGNREVRDKAAEKELADMRREKKQDKAQRKQQLDAAWGEEGDD